MSDEDALLLDGDEVHMTTKAIAIVTDGHQMSTECVHSRCADVSFGIPSRQEFVLVYCVL